MGRRQRRRQRQRRAGQGSSGVGGGGGSAPGPATTDYTDAEGNVLTLRDRVSAGTVTELSRPQGRPGASPEDAWQRRTELLFERLTVSWTIAGLPIEGQSELLGRYRKRGGGCARRWTATCASTSPSWRSEAARAPGAGCARLSRT